MAKEFSLDDADFNQKETHDIEQLPSVKPSTTVAVETMGFFEGKPESQDDVSMMECDDNEKVSTNGKENEVQFIWSPAIYISTILYKFPFRQHKLKSEIRSQSLELKIV